MHPLSQDDFSNGYYTIAECARRLAKSPQTVYNWIGKGDFPPVVRVASRPLGLKVGEGLHILRHTCVSNLIKFGFTPKEIQNWVGHESILETMDTYGHLFPDHYSEIGSVLDEKFASLKTKGSTSSFITVA